MAPRVAGMWAGGITYYSIGRRAFEPGNEAASMDWKGRACLRTSNVDPMTDPGEA